MRRKLNILLITLIIIISFNKITFADDIIPPGPRIKLLDKKISDLILNNYSVINITYGNSKMIYSLKKDKTDEKNKIIDNPLLIMCVVSLSDGRIFCYDLG